MSREDRERFRKQLSKHKRNRSAAEVEDLLSRFGFIMRDASKEAGVWKRGPVGLTLPRPHDRVLKLSYVSLALRKIREAEDQGIPEERPS